MTEEHLTPTRRVVRPWSLVGLSCLLMVLVLALAPAVAATGRSGRNQADPDAVRSARSTPADAGDRGATAVAALPVAGPRRVTLGLSRLFTTQFDGSPYANGNCNMATGAMLFEVQTGRTVTGAQMRRWSGARTQGTNLLDLRRAFRRGGQWVEIAEDMRWRSFVREVRSGRSAVVQGWYGNLRSNILQAGFTTAHSVFVLGYSSHAMQGRGGFYVMDPLGMGDYDGAWWSRQELRRFGWSGSPNTIGGGRNAFYGNVALQSSPSKKDLSSKAYRPQFQSYWDTSKALMKRARQVNLVQRRPGLPAFVLKVEDPGLRLSAGTAKQRDLRLPLRSWKQHVRGFRTNDKRLIVRTAPMAKVTAAASGRVIYRGWTLDGTMTLWIQHGPNLFTIYKGLATTRVEPGHWVRGGGVLGKVEVRMTGKGRNAQRSGTFRFIVSVGNPRLASSRQYPLPFLGGSNGTLR